jgi:hypothetical protein
MICYKGNSFFRIFKIYLKDFAKKVKMSFHKKTCRFKEKRRQIQLVFCTNKKIFCTKK